MSSPMDRALLTFGGIKQDHRTLAELEAMSSKLTQRIVLQEKKLRSLTETLTTAETFPHLLDNPEAYSVVLDAALTEFCVDSMENFNVERALRYRINHLKDYLKKYNLNGIVLGISGGVDSFVAGSLAQIAVTELKEESAPERVCNFHAVRLPYKKQADEDIAQMALDLIKPDIIHEVDIGKAVDDINYYTWLNVTSDLKITNEQADFAKGNLKARMRMAAQYQIAGLTNSVVLGTDHNAEGILAFYTKFGDGACDLLVLNGLNKRQVRACAKALGAPESIYNKPATADLEDLQPGLLDEEATGIPYDVLDDFLEGKDIDKVDERKILEYYLKNAHKRRGIVSYEEPQEIKEF